MHAARKTDAAPGHALPRNVAVQGLEVSLRHVLQDLLLQRQFGHQSPQTTVLLLQLLHPSCLFQLQSAVFLAPAIIGLFSYARFSAGLPGGLVVGYFDFDLPQDRDDLLSAMFFPRHAPASSRTSFSNISPGTKFAGQVTYKRFPHAQAIQSYRRAIELNPNFDEAHHQLGFVYLHIGMLDKGQQEIENALTINPGNTLARYRLGVIDMCRAKYADAFQIFNSTPLEQNPELLAFYTSNALFRLGRNDEASALIARYFKDYSKDKGGMVTSVKAMMLAKAGKNSEAEATIQHAIEIGRGYAHFHHTSYNIASAYALMNEPEQAMKWLQVTADEGFPNYPLFEGDAQLDNLKKDPRFTAFMVQQKQQWEHFSATL